MFFTVLFIHLINNVSKLVPQDLFRFFDFGDGAKNIIKISKKYPISKSGNEVAKSKILL